MTSSALDKVVVCANPRKTEIPRYSPLYPLRRIHKDTWDHISQSMGCALKDSASHTNHRMYISATVQLCLCATSELVNIADWLVGWLACLTWLVTR